MTNNNYILSFLLPGAIVASAAILSVAIFLTVKEYGATASFTDKAEAVQGCFAVATGEKQTTGTTGDGIWTVNEATINFEVVNECLLQKGY